MNDCTELFLQYRQIIRIVWNCGFYKDARLREYDALLRFYQCAALIYEALVLLASDYDVRVQNPFNPGLAVPVYVKRGHTSQTILIDESPADAPGGVWRDAGPLPVELSLRFVRLFDWDELGIRDFEWAEVELPNHDDQASLGTRRALVRVSDCKFLIKQIG